MADDDKKINLPDIIPEVDRREVIRGGLATAGRMIRKQIYLL